MNKVLVRLKNRRVLTAVISGVLMILVNIGVIDLAMSDQFNELANIILGIGVTIGIFSNPESHIQGDTEEQ